MSSSVLSQGAPCCPLIFANVFSSIASAAHSKLVPFWFSLASAADIGDNAGQESAKCISLSGGVIDMHTESVKNQALNSKDRTAP